jgi:peptidoglycan/xylan/chitin deacetylase (PgdA/CDA1 family)
MKKYYIEKLAGLFSAPLFYSQIHLLTRPFYSGRGQILMFHRVVPESKKLRVHNHKSLEVTPEYLEHLILFFKDLNYQFISLNDLYLLRDEANKNKKYVIFTFDDGYVDNYQYAYPIFKKHNIPFTIYVTTSLPDSEAILWWYLLEDIVVNKSLIKIAFEGKEVTFRTETLGEKENAFEKIRSWFALADKKKQDSLIKSLFAGCEADIVKKTKDLSLTWQHIYELSQDPLVTIGSHTVNHFPLNSLTEEQSVYEINESKKIIESHISKEVKHFCYPLGSYGKKEIEILKKANYESATTIKMANIFVRNLEQPFSLPRIMINSLTTDPILHLQVNGFLPAVRNKFRRVVI